MYQVLICEYIGMSPQIIYNFCTFTAALCSYFFDLVNTDKKVTKKLVPNVQNLDLRTDTISTEEKLFKLKLV
jgi:hypothetical protein